MNVLELIEKLKEMKPEAEVLIDDADTGWMLDIITIEYNEPRGGAGNGPGTVTLGGSYYDD